MYARSAVTDLKIIARRPEVAVPDIAER